MRTAPLLALAALLLAAPSPALAEDLVCEGDVEAWIDEVVEKGARDAYRCLAATDAAGPALLARTQAEGFEDLKFHERVTRALAVHLMERLDRPLDAALVRGLGAADRRILRDAVYARRGRRSPSPAHHAVFEQFDWYEPSPTYNNGALTELDRANIALIDDPPAPPEPEAPPSAADAVAETAQAPAPEASSGCGCATGAAPVSALLALVPLVAVGRRR